MSFLKTLMDSLSAISGSVANASETEKKRTVAVMKNLPISKTTAALLTT